MKSLLCHSSSDWPIVQNKVQFVRGHRHMLIKDLVQESQSTDTSALLQGFELQFLQQHCHTG